MVDQGMGVADGEKERMEGLFTTVNRKFQPVGAGPVMEQPRELIKGL